jgi:large subunit ribosomal protein L10
VRESGGEFHVVKNTLVKLALEASGYAIPEGLLENSSAASFAFTDPAGTAKALSEAAKGLEAIKVKGGYMGTEVLDAARVKALADLPPLPVVRGQLLGVLQAPAGKLVRTIAEPARSLASVFRAYSEKTQAAA